MINQPVNPQNIQVAHLTCGHTPFDTRIFYKELKSLSKAGYDLVLVVPHTCDEVVEGIQIRAVSKPRGRLERMTLTPWRVLRMAWQENANLYHFHDPELLPWVQFLRLRGKTVIFDMHENTPKALLARPWIPSVIRPAVAFLYRLLERILMWRMPVILVFAEHSSHMADYRWIDRRHVTILNMPITEELLQIKELPYSVPTVGYMGGVNEDRGSMVTLEALHHLKEAGYTVEWDCIGRLTAAHRTQMENFIETHGLDGVRIHGYMLPTEGYRIIAHCHIGLSVLAPVPNAIEAYPTKMFEYMALGLPVIASGFPLYREVVEGAECGLCLDDPDNPQEMAEAIRWLLDHPEEAQAMGRRGREAVVQHYSWEIEEEKLLTFYSQFSQVQTANKQ